jgi:hypothetical protein
MVVSELDNAGLLVAMNTQPYTMFGVFIILFGALAPIPLYLFTAIFSFCYRVIGNPIVKIVLLYCFLGILSSFGLEVVVANSVHLAVSMFFMYALIRVLSRIAIFNGNLRADRLRLGFDSK